MRESTVWAVVVVCATVIVCSLVYFGIEGGNQLGLAAIEKGLCQGTVPGYQSYVYTTCPVGN